MIREKVTIIAFLLFSFFSVTSQTFQFSSGLMLGGSNYQGDLVESSLFKASETNFAAGAYLRAKYKHNLSGRLNLMFAGISGADSSARGVIFSTDIFETTGLVEWQIPLKISKPILSPYIFAGLGFSVLNHDVFYGENSTGDPNIETDKSETQNNKTVLSIPIGVGVRRNLNEKFYLEAEAAYRLTGNDYLDGVSESGNPDANDWWISGTIGIGYRLSYGKDTDGDGVTDRLDKCPKTPGERKNNGCPDSDNDGITDRLDKCPHLAGPRDLKGCPDSDGDSLVDSEDDCPNIPGSITLRGCPDSDGDGIIDMEDFCPNAAGSRSLGGCPDKDGDGISDPNDNCPDQRGTIENSGCPDGK